MAKHWQDKPDDTYRIRAEFADGEVAYTTVEHAADALDFIDRDRGIVDLLASVPFRSHLGTMYVLADPDLGWAGKFFHDAGA